MSQILKNYEPNSMIYPIQSSSKFLTFQKKKKTNGPYSNQEFSYQTVDVGSKKSMDRVEDAMLKEGMLVLPRIN